MGEGEGKGGLVSRGFVLGMAREIPDQYTVYGKDDHNQITYEFPLLIRNLKDTLNNFLVLM